MNKNTVYKLIFAFALVLVFSKAQNALACDPCFTYEPVPTYYGNLNLNSSVSSSSASGYSPTQTQYPQNGTSSSAYYGNGSNYQPVSTYYGSQNLNSSMNGSSNVPQNSNPIPNVHSSTYSGNTVHHTVKPTVKKDCCDCDCGCLNEYEKLALANYAANYGNQSMYSNTTTTKSAGSKLSDFFPHTFWGWLLVFVLIFSIFVAYKYATKKKKVEAPKVEDSNLPKIA